MTVQQLCVHTKILSDVLWPDDTPVPDNRLFLDEKRQILVRALENNVIFLFTPFLSHFKSILTPCSPGSSYHPL